MVGYFAHLSHRVGGTWFCLNFVWQTLLTPQMRTYPLHRADGGMECGRGMEEREEGELELVCKKKTKTLKKSQTNFL